MAKTTIPAGYIAANAITATEIAANAITAAAIATDAISADIADNAITAAKIAKNAVSSSELASNALSGQNFTGDVTFDTTTLFIDSSNDRVGIGTDSPNANLEINPASGNSELKITSTDNSGNSIRLYQGYNSYLVASNNVYMSANGNSDMFNLVNGNVGINETLPTYRLQVDGTNVSSEGGLANLCLVDRTAYNGTNPGAGITFRGEYTSGGNTTNFATIQGIKENATSGNYASALRFTTRANGGNLTERMRIDSLGNVGVGLTPSSYLTYGYKMRLYDATQSYITFNNSTYSTQVTGGFVIGFDGTARVIQRENLPMTFSTNNTEAMRITNTQKLELKGDINFTKQDGMSIAGYESIIIQIDSNNNQTGRVFQVNDYTDPLLVVPQRGGGAVTINNLHAASEPFTNLDIRGLNTTAGTDYAGIAIYGDVQSHIRFKTGGGTTTWDDGNGYQWQLRMGNGANQDQMEFYAWTGGKRVITMYGSNGNVSMPYQAAARYGLPSATTITTTLQVLNFSSTNGTYGGFVQGGLSNSSGTITVPSAGIYQFNLQVRTEGAPFATATQFYFEVDNSGSGSGSFSSSWGRLYLNGSSGAGSYEHASMTHTFQLVSGARVRVTAYHGGSNFVLSEMSNSVCYLNVHKIA